MMVTTFYLIFVLALVIAGVSFWIGQRPVLDAWLAPASAILSSVFFMIAAVESSSLQVSTENGLETVSEPALGIIAFSLGIIMILIGTVMSLTWLNGGHHAN